MIQNGVPGYIRRDNGPEFIATKVQQWLRDNQIKAIYMNRIARGKMDISKVFTAVSVTNV